MTNSTMRRRIPQFVRGSKLIAKCKRRQVALVDDFSAIGASWNILDVPYTACGTDIGNRIGRVINLRRFFLRGMLVGGQSNLVTDDSYNTVRMVCFVGRAGLVTADWAARNIDDPVLPGVDGVKQVLVDRVITLQVPALDSTGYIPATKHVAWETNLSLQVEYGEAAASVPAGSDSLYLALVSDSAAAPNPGFTVGFHCLLWQDLA